MRDVDLAAGPFGKNGRAAHRLDRGDVRVLSEVRGWIAASLLLQPLAAPAQDGVILGMHGAANAPPREDFERVENRPVFVTRDQWIFAGHIELERDRPGVEHRLEL